MDLGEFQKQVVKTREEVLKDKNFDLHHELMTMCAGMCEESGEALGRISQKLNGSCLFDHQAYLLDLANCLIYLTMLAHYKDIELTSKSLKEQTYSASQSLFEIGFVLCSECAELGLMTVDNGLPDTWKYDVLAILHAIQDCLGHLDIKSSMEEIMLLVSEELTN